MDDERRVIVIGSGPTGAIAAEVLVRRGVSVTMIESGTARPSGALVRVAGRNVFRRNVDVVSQPERFVVSGDPNTTWCTNLALGGLSNQWTGAVPRFSPEDFNDGERLDGRYCWPIRYEDIASYYEYAERRLCVTSAGFDVPALPAGEVAIRRRLPADWQRLAVTARSHGQGFTVLPLADGPAWLLGGRGTAFNSYHAIVASLLSDSQFQLRTGTHALRLEWSGAQRRVTSVICHDRASGGQVRLPAAAVVIAAGPLHSTKLLFDSACADFPDGLGNENGVLGRYFHDHPKEWWSVELDTPLSRLSPAGYLTRRPYQESTPLMAASWTVGLASPRDRILSLTPLKGRKAGVQVFGTMQPDERRWVRPHRESVDEFGLPQLELSIRFSEDEIANVVAARRHFMDLMAEAGVECTLDAVVPQLHPGHAVHYGGTARMHRSPSFGVVDDWNRVFGVENVIVSDASCFTTNTEKNPTLTAMALSARAADHLVDDVRHG